MEDTFVGKVKFFMAKRGYGFIVGPNEEDVFVHFSHINMEGYKVLTKGQEVKYSTEHTDKGPQARNVVPA